jgi:inhibitor of KinA sporulation pathway (predicted exonuclease)
VGRTWSKDWSAIGRASALEEHCVMFWYSRFSVGTSRRRVSLANALKQCGITVEGRAHRALADAEATRLVLRHMAAATP